jgi:hypothetical protein
MDPIQERHDRPEDDVLRLRGDEPLPPPARAGARERRPEEGAVDEVRPEADGPPPPPVTRDHGAEEADVGVAGGRADEAGDARFRSGPGGRGGRSGDGSSDHARQRILPPWTRSASTSAGG